MAGARRQIFMAFAVFLLVKKFEFPIQDIALLFLINNGIEFFTNPLIGKFIIRYGERRLLSLEYFSLVLIFIAYAFVESRMLVGFLYVLDHLFFSCSMGIKTYFQKIADQGISAPVWQWDLPSTISLPLSYLLLEDFYGWWIIKFPSWPEQGSVLFPSPWFN